MALIKSPLSKSKPCLFLPFTHVRKLNSPPTKLNYLLVASNSSAKRGLQATADDEYAPLSGAETRSFGKIFLSDVVVRRRRRVFQGRKWNSLDIGTAVVILAMHVLCLCAPFYFTWTAFWVASGLYVVTGLLGITLSFHRNLSHRSFKLPKWLEYFFAYCGVQALQGVRIVLVFHITWLVNSVSHVWGKQAWNTGDLSRNNWWLALVTFGEGWHNNHHAFEYSAKHGLEWWQIDITWYVVRFLQAIGLATDVKVPSEAQKQRMAFMKEAFQPEPIS